MEPLMVAARQKESASRRRVRTCARCREPIAARHPGGRQSRGGKLGEGEPSGIRWVLSPEGEVFPDLTGRSWGRGSWLHASPRCLQGVERSLSRSFRSQVKTSDRDAMERLGQAAELRVWQLLGAGKRRRLMAVGGAEVEDAWKSGRAKLLVVAGDARAVAETPAVRSGVTAGIARVWGDKAGLGQVFGRPEVGVVAALDQRLAEDVFDAIAMALLASGTPGSEPAASNPVSVPDSKAPDGSEGKKTV